MDLSQVREQAVTMRGWVAVVLAGCLWVPAAASAAPAAEPELLVLVSAGSNGIDHVAITYWGAVSERTARDHLRALLKSTGWEAEAVVVDAPKKASGKQQQMTSVSFNAPAIVPYPGGILPVVPFILAYKEYASLVVLFQIQRPFGFGGPASYQDGQVALTLQQSPNLYRYDVRITDGSFTTLTLPSAPAAAETTSQQETAPPARKSPPIYLVLALIVLASVGVGAAVYLYLASHTSGASRPRG